MQASTSFNSFDASVRTAIDQLQQDDCQYDHVMLASADAGGKRSAPLRLVETGAGGLDALRTRLASRETLFALLRLQSRTLLVVSIGKNLPGLKRAHVLVQGRNLQSSLGATLFAAVTIISPSQLTLALVGSALKLQGFDPVPPPSITDDFRASWASTSTVRRPSVPKATGQVDHVGRGSRPASDLGPSQRKLEGLPASVSFPASLADQNHVGDPGMVIEIGSVFEAPARNNETVDDQAAPVLPTRKALPPLPSGNDTIEKPSKPVEVPIPSSTAISTKEDVHKPLEAFKQASVKPKRAVKRSLRPLSAKERAQLSDLQQRLRADEAIRDQVMKQLHAEQQISTKPVTDRPVPTTSPPPGPPPSFAPPPVPISPPGASASSRPSTGGSKTIRGVRSENRDESNSSAQPETPATPAFQFESPHWRPLSAPSYDVEDLKSLYGSPDHRRKQSEDHESVGGTSTQSLPIWEFPHVPSRFDDPFSKPSSPRRDISQGSLCPEVQLSDSKGPGPSGRLDDERPSSDTSCSDGHESPSCTASSSLRSIVAPSIFDKDLPTPPEETRWELGGEQDWTGGLGLLDWLPHTPAPWSDTNATSQDGEGGGATCVEDAEMQDLRERLAQAEARAKAAERAAKVAIQEARSETERLAKELANVERGTKDQMEAEAIRRAKWAKEQAARNQLDAYERSKLEADESRRRRAIEEQRALECDRARRIREEQEWREQEADRIKQEYEIKIQILAEREAALKAEAEAKEGRERERRLQQQAKEHHQRCRLKDLTEALQGVIDSDGEAAARPMLAGWLNLQLDGEVHRKRRWYEVIGRELVLCRSATDRSLETTIGLDSTRLLWVSDQHEDCTMVQSLVLEVQQGCATACQSYIIHLESTSAKEDMELMIEAISRL